jgi:hypothetical protein
VDKEQGTEGTLVRVFQHGWNLFGMYRMKVVKSDCDSTQFKLYEYTNGQFEKVKEPKIGRAYWLYNAGKECSLESIPQNTETFKDLKELQPGWNFVPVIAPMIGKKTEELGCSLRAAYFYKIDHWESAMGHEFQPGDISNAFVAYSDNACALGNTTEEEPTPPPLPPIDLTQEVSP